ncbi:MAG: TerC family protein [Pelosinus sp.]|nr:TerC family protein [Pelosinus sp.]
MLSPEWITALSSILLVNLILSGDNAVIIALASKRLPAEQRNKAIFWGSAGAVVLRIILTFVAALLLDIPYLQFLGGLALLYIAINLLGDDKNEEDCAAAHSLKEAVKIILFADLIMSLDNVLALAAIAQTVPGSKYSLIIIGLLISIPMVVFGAQLLMKLMDKFPAIVYLGAGILGYAAAEMISGDKALGPWLHRFENYLIVLLIIAVIAIGHWKKTRNKQKATPKHCPE